MTNHAQLTIIKGPQHHLHQVFLLAKEKERLIGRSSICHFRVDDPLASSLHCLIYFKNENFRIRDLLSANGVFVDDHLVEETLLEPSQKIRIGKMLLEFSPYTQQEEGKKYLTGDETPLAEEIRPEAENEAKNKDTTETPLGRQIKNAKDLNVLRLALQYNLITAVQIKDLMKIAIAAKETICNIIIADKILTSEKIDTLVQEHKYNKIAHKDTLLGKFAIRYHMTTQERVDECLAIQKKQHQQQQKIPRLSQIMVEKQYLTIQQNNKLIKILTQERYT